MGENIEGLAKKLISHGADQVFIVDHPSLKDFNDESYVNIFTQLVKKYKPEIILIGATTYGRSMGPRISSRLNTGLTADCTLLEIDMKTRNLMQTRPAFGGNLVATIVCPNHRPQISTVRPKVMKPLTLDITKKGEIIRPDVQIPLNTKVQVIKVVKDFWEQVNIDEADVIVGVGRGIGGPDNLQIIYDLAKTLGAVVGASRAVVDAGWMEYTYQVGQTGKTVTPKVYIACGISGAIQHISGISSADTIIAINKDPDAPIFKIAHIGIIGNVLEIVPALTKALARR